MSDQQLFIPRRLRVGFQKREGTYNGILAYVIYYDAKGKLRREPSFEGWRHKDIEPVEHDNVPTEGFVLNRDVGGVRSGSHSWDQRIEMVRVWDPRGWEFEITIPNLLLILRDAASDPGKGLRGSFVYAWPGAGKIALLPTASPDYRACAGYTALQGKGVKLRDLKPGNTYLTKRQEQWVYLGRFPYYWGLHDKQEGPTEDRRLVFAEYVLKNRWRPEEGRTWRLVYQKNPSQVGEEVSQTPPDNFAELLDMHIRTERGSRVKELFLKPAPGGGSVPRFAFEARPGVFVIANLHRADQYYNGSVVTVGIRWEVEVSQCGDAVRIRHARSYSGDVWAYHPDYREHERGSFYRGDQTFTPRSPNPWREPTTDLLYARLECGAEVEIGPYSLRKD